MSTVVLGLGNLVHSDDGVGVQAVQRLQQDDRVPSSVALIDGGTNGLSLLPHLSGCDRLLVIDAIDTEESPGTILRLDGRALAELPGKASVHQMGFADLMVAMKLLGEIPAEVVVLGIQPMSTEWGIQLSTPVERTFDCLIQAVLTQLHLWQQAGSDN